MSDSSESQSVREGSDTSAPENTSHLLEPENPQPPATEAPVTEAPATEAPATEAPATEPPATDAAHIAPPLDGLITAIRAAVARGASPEQRAAGATALRSILTVLEAKPGEPLTAAPSPPVSPASTASPIVALLKQPGVLAKLAAMSREQLIDLVKQTVAAMGKSPQAEQPTGPRFHLIQIPQTQRPGGGT